MASRHRDWFTQAKSDLLHARTSLTAGDYDWVCFATHQAAEKAVKAIFQKLGADVRGHSIQKMLKHLPEDLRVNTNLLDDAAELDRHYIPPRYPNAHPEGAPTEIYTAREAEDAIKKATRILAFCEDHLSG